MLSWVALHLAVAISALDGDESSRRELDINYSNQCKNLATKYEQRNTMCLLGVGERRWGRHVDKATDFHRNLVFTNDAVYDFHFRMGTSTQVAVDEYMARKHPPVPIGPETP